MVEHLLSTYKTLGSMPRTELYIHMYIIYTHICVFVYAYDDTSMFLCIWVDGQAGGW